MIESDCSMLRRTRRWSGLSLKEVARATGVPFGSLAQIERRELVAAAKHRKALSEFFGKPEDDFFDDSMRGLAK